MVMGKLPVPGRPTFLTTVGQGPIVLAVGAGGGVVWTFLLSSILSPLSPSLWETARYRLKYCLKGPLNPKQPTNQIDNLGLNFFQKRSGMHRSCLTLRYEIRTSNEVNDVTFTSILSLRYANFHATSVRRQLQAAFLNRKFLFIHSIKWHLSHF